jgi:NADPH:quinone reductase-like Zn-dependent oxidoreductase
VPEWIANGALRQDTARVLATVSTPAKAALAEAAGADAALGYREPGFLDALAELAVAAIRPVNLALR